MEYVDMGCKVLSSFEKKKTPSQNLRSTCSSGCHLQHVTLVEIRVLIDDNAIGVSDIFCA